MSPRFLRHCLVCGRLSHQRRCPEHGGSRAVHDDLDYRTNRITVLRNATACALCGNPPTDGDPLTADHIGDSTDHSIPNLRAVHASCNASRGAPTDRLAGRRVGGHVSIEDAESSPRNSPPLSGEIGRGSA